MLLALIVAFGSGVVSFVSPCTVPLLPAYVGVLSGSTVGVPAEQQTFRLVRGSLLYVFGFTMVFAALGVSAGAFGRQVRQAGGPVQRVGGVVVLLLAIALLLESRFGALARIAPGGDRGRSRLAKSGRGLAPLALGVIFATAFTPCVGPFLGAILTLAATQGGAVRGAALLAVYGLGLGVPFVLASLGVAGNPALARWLNRLARPVAAVGAGLLAVLGVLLVSGAYGSAAGYLARFNPLA